MSLRTSTSHATDSVPTAQPARLESSLAILRRSLSAERTPHGAWTGRLSSSALATATAISALSLAGQHIDDDEHLDGKCDRNWLSGVMMRNQLNELLTQSLGWLAKQQNEDGGWGDTDRSQSNIATTMLVEAAFQLTGVPASYSGMLERAQAYVKAEGGVAGLRKRYGKDKTFAVPILANCALAGLVPWSKVSALPFELACLPQRWYHRLGLPVVSYAIPALVAIGQAKFHHAPGWNPITRLIRRLARKKSLEVLANMQPESGGYLEATPLTSFVVMSLASTGQADHRVVRAGVEFLLASVRHDGSWPIDTDLATWNTTQAVVALDWEFGHPTPSEEAASEQPIGCSPSKEATQTLDWLLSCQRQEKYPYTGAAPGGWAWTDQSGGVPDADDTAAALMALAAWRQRWPNIRRDEIEQAAQSGVQWLLGLQNRDGGMPTFCRGWGKLPFDRSSVDITAHAVRGLEAWRKLLNLRREQPLFESRIEEAIAAATQFLEGQQGDDGRWNALWFGNQLQADESNPVYGTSKALMMYASLGRLNNAHARAGVHFLVRHQFTSGGWGATDSATDPGMGRSRAVKMQDKPIDAVSEDYPPCSVEETALAVEALLPFATGDSRVANCVQRGVDWLCDAAERGGYELAEPIGFYFAKLWYYERLYPKIFATQALRRVRQMTS